MKIVSKLTFFFSEKFWLLWISFCEKKFSGSPMRSGWPQEWLAVGSCGDPTSMTRNCRKSWLVNATECLRVPGCICIFLYYFFFFKLSNLCWLRCSFGSLETNLQSSWATPCPRSRHPREASRLFHWTVENWRCLTFGSALETAALSPHFVWSWYVAVEDKEQHLS